MKLLFIGLGGSELLLILVGLPALFLLFPIWTIFKKSGQNPWMSLLIFIPGIGILIALYVAAFSNWRIREKP